METKVCNHNCECKTGEDCNGEKVVNFLEIHDCNKSWKEDYSHENGQYINKCIQCECFFMGHKRRVLCKDCG